MFARSEATAHRYRDRRHLALSPSGGGRRDALSGASAPSSASSRRATRLLQAAVVLEEEFPYDWSDGTCRLWFFDHGLPGYSWYVPKAGGHLNVGIGAMAGELKAQARRDPAALATADRRSWRRKGSSPSGAGTRAATPTICAATRTWSAGTGRSSSATPPACPRAICARASVRRCARDWPRRRDRLGRRGYSLARVARSLGRAAEPGASRPRTWARLTAALERCRRSGHLAIARQFAMESLTVPAGASSDGRRGLETRRPCR